jgi:AraC-like DNA-binding protein
LVPAQPIRRSLLPHRKALLLGYQEIGAFSRAFKRWSGETPREMRAKRSAA